jgi:hypothetical protein
MAGWVFEQCFGRGLRRETERYLSDLSQAPVRTSRQEARDVLAGLRDAPGPKMALGATQWNELVQVPVHEIVKAHALITGGTGAGKTVFVLLAIHDLIDLMPREHTMGFGLIDVAKSDLYAGTLFLLAKRIEHLAVHDPAAARELRRRVVIIDFSSRDPVSPYNIMVRWRGADPDFFSTSRTDLLLGLFRGDEKPSLAGRALLEKSILLLSEDAWPITFLEDLLHDERFRRTLLARSKHQAVTAYFMRQFPQLPKATVAALSRRIEALFVSEGVRAALSGTGAPDFCRLQDESKIVLVNCFGESISRGVRQLLQALVVSDIHQAVFRRTQKGRPFLWFLDESQNLFGS